MSVDPFKSTSYQVGRILNAFTSDADGNLIFVDIPNPNGITLSEIIAGLISSTTTSLNGSSYFKKVNAEDFTLITYSVDNNPPISGYAYNIQHNFALNNKEAFMINVVKTSTGQVIAAQDVYAVDSNTIQLIMADTTPVSVSVIGLQS